MNRWLAIAGVLLAFLLGFVFLRGPTPHISISAETLTTLGPVGITNTMITSWVIVVLIVGTVFAAARSIQLIPGRPSHRQRFAHPRSCGAMKTTRSCIEL